MTALLKRAYLTLMHSGRLQSLLAPIRIRYLLLVIAVLGLVFFTLVFLGIRQARQSLLKIMVDDGKALAASLTLSSTNAIQARLLLENLTEERFADLALAADARLYGVTDPAQFQLFCEENSLLSIDFLDSSITITGSDRWVAGYVPEYPPTVAAEIWDMRVTGGGYRSVMVYGDTTEPPIQYFLYAFAPPDGGFAVLAADGQYFDQISKAIGIGELIQNISGQTGIIYIVLQSREGIILSSRQLPPLLSIASDSFLDSLMNTDTTGWRLQTFEGEEVLEIARRFESVSYPPGVYRIAIDLDEYHEISAGYNNEIITFGVILFLLTLAVVAIVSVNQNYFILDRSYRRMRSMSETIFDRLSSAVLACDGEGKITAVNRALTELTGIDSEWVGRAITAVKQKLSLDWPGDAPAGERLVSLEQHLVTPSGEKRAVLIGISSLPSDAGGGTVILIYDITDQKRLEFENRRRERMSEMGDMAAGVAHEIRNPLNAISIAAQRLKMEFSPTEEREDYDRLIGNVISESARLNQILTRFLELARTRATEDTIVDLAEPIGKAIEALSGEAEAQGVTITYAHHESIRVRTDSQRLQQVFINLLKNGLQAMPNGGKIMITVTPEPAGKVTIKVVDSGPGFAPNVLPKVFQPYFTTRPDGSGLGLALAYKTITDYGGEISAANSASTIGAEITIILPSA
ncbi:MAG: ATP-binding protein [candidate division Zixibacteria bacterium]|nr:ATP-binding protein [candidate division Zixibacteria bacterium]